MRRLARHLFTRCSAASLLLCVAACVLWVRSYQTGLSAGWGRSVLVDGRWSTLTASADAERGALKCVLGRHDSRVREALSAYDEADGFAWDSWEGPADPIGDGHWNWAWSWSGFAYADEPLHTDDGKHHFQVLVLPLWAMLVAAAVLP